MTNKWVAANAQALHVAVTPELPQEDGQFIFDAKDAAPALWAQLLDTGDCRRCSSLDTGCFFQAAFAGQDLLSDTAMDSERAVTSNCTPAYSVLQGYQ